MISVRLVEFSGSGSRSGLPRRKKARDAGRAFVERLLNDVHSLV